MRTIHHSILLAMLTASGQPSTAQVAVPQTPLNDANCSYAQAVGSSPFGFNQPVPPTTVPTGCPVDGTRTVTVLPGTVETVSPINGTGGRPTGTSQVFGTYQVNFTGNLHPDGIPVLAGGAGPVVLDATSLFGAATSVSLTTQYVGALNGVQVSSTDAANHDFSYFQNYRAFQTTVGAINVNQVGTPVTSNGRTYGVSVTTPNPTAIVGGNSAAISGRYNSTDSAGALVFGRITGTATLLQNAGVTPSPDTSINGTYNTGYFAPFALQYQTTSVETTRLDETGLVTPTVSVTNGINLNGSTISNVAAGVAAGDAVNRAQLNAEANARIASDAQLTASLASETTQRLAADNAMATRVTALEGSLSTIDSRLKIIDRRASSGTAVATAMSGNAFLPDMKFNLTANVATYDGSHAGAVQMGALVSRHVAVNAGVAVGFNHGGKTAARAGMTFGW